MFDLLFPSYCVNCGRLGEYLCTKCSKRLRKSLPECYKCRRLSPRYLTHISCKEANIQAVFVGWQYNSVAKKLLSQYKYRCAYSLSKILSEFLIKRLTETGFLKNIDSDSLLLPVPIHRSHKRDRGFNQSQLISQHLSNQLGIKMVEDIITRVGDSSYQSQSEAYKRKTLGDVFIVKKKYLNKNIVVVDDVISTGTTLDRVAKSLEGNNLKAITLFRGRPHYSQ